MDGPYRTKKPLRHTNLSYNRNSLALSLSLAFRRLKLNPYCNPNFLSLSLSLPLRRTCVYNIIAAACA